MIELYKGDCLIESDKIESGSVDLILTDLPYGTMGMEGADHGMNGKVAWDEAIDTDKLMNLVGMMKIHVLSNFYAYQT